MSREVLSALATTVTMLVIFGISTLLVLFPNAFQWVALGAFAVTITMLTYAFFMMYFEDAE